MRPRILFLTTELPWPVDGGGKLRTYETLACLSRFAEVRLLSFSEGDDGEEGARSLAAALPGVEVEAPIPHPIRIRRRPWALAKTALYRLALREPYLVAKFRNASYRKAALGHAASLSPRVVWCDHLNVFPAASAAARQAGARLILDQHNVEADLFLRGAGASPLLRRLSKLEGRRLAAYESAALRGADRVVAISADDASRFREMGAADRVAAILPSMGELGERLGPPPGGKTVAFLGTLSWPPNAEGVRWLARDVLPILRGLVPGIRVVVGGKGLPPAIAKEASEAGVELRGWVEDPLAFMREAGTVVVPILSGSGISMKLLDAMRAGVPIVSTPAGARGLPLRSGVELSLAEGAEAFARATAAILGDEALRSERVEAAWAYLEENHASPALVAAYRRLVEGDVS